MFIIDVLVGYVTHQVTL